MATANMTVILKLCTVNDKQKRKVMKTVCSITGIESVAIDAASQKLTVVCGSADPIHVVTKLRKQCCSCVDVISVAAPKKKEAPAPAPALSAPPCIYYNPYPAYGYCCHPY